MKNANNLYVDIMLVVITYVYWLGHFVPAASVQDVVVIEDSDIEVKKQDVISVHLF